MIKKWWGKKKCDKNWNLKKKDKSIETLKININYQIGPRRAGDPGQLVSNNEKATKILHWQPSYSLEEIIKSEYQFRKNNKQ